MLRRQSWRPVRYGLHVRADFQDARIARTIIYAGAGHPSSLLFQRHARKVVQLSENGLFIGPIPLDVRPTRTSRFPFRVAISCFSTRRPHRGMWTGWPGGWPSERLEHLLLDTEDLEPAEFVEELFQKISTPAQRDDLTVVLAQFGLEDVQWVCRSTISAPSVLVLLVILTHTDDPAAADQEHRRSGRRSAHRGQAAKALPGTLEPDCVRYRGGDRRRDLYDNRNCRSRSAFDDSVCPQRSATRFDFARQLRGIGDRPPGRGTRPYACPLYWSRSPADSRLSATRNWPR